MSKCYMYTCVLCKLSVFISNCTIKFTICRVKSGFIVQCNCIINLHYYIKKLLTFFKVHNKELKDVL